MRSIPPPLKRNSIWIITLLVIIGSSIHLDFKTASEVMSILTGIKEKTGVTLVMTHHSLEVAKKCSNTIFIVRDGRLIKEAPASDLDKESLANLYEINTPAA